MKIYRLSPHKSLKAAFIGEGAKQFGGRWNRPGTPIIYAASTLSLAVLEVLVHLDPDLFPRHYSFEIEISDDVVVSALEQSLPENWRTYPAPESLQDIGSVWATENSSVALRVPSVIVPNEFNWLLNPTHADFTKLIIADPTPFQLDPRLTPDFQNPSK